MDTGRSRRRPFQPFVVRSQLWVEGLPLLQITLRKLHKLAQILAAMVAAYRLVHSPPDQLDRIALCGLHAGSAYCMRTRPPLAFTYSSTRPLVWLRSLSMA